MATPWTQDFLPPPPPPPDEDERLLARIHVTAFDHGPWDPNDGIHNPVSLDGTNGTLILTDRRLVYMTQTLTGRDLDSEEINEHISEGGVSIPLPTLLETRSGLTGDALNDAGEAWLAVRYQAAAGEAVNSFTTGSFAFGWAGFREWETAIQDLNAGREVYAL